MFAEIRGELDALVTEWSAVLGELSDARAIGNRNSQNRTVKQIVGHMVDSAVNNHHRIVRLQYVQALEFPDYRLQNDQWIAIQNYEGERWDRLVDFWTSYNRHMGHIIENIDSACLEHTWVDCDGNTETLRSIVEGYLWHFKLHIEEIRALISA